MEKYEVIETKRIEELATDGVLLRHKKSGARIFTMKNDDDNKVFGIAFEPRLRTRPALLTSQSIPCCAALKNTR